MPNPGGDVEQQVSEQADFKPYRVEADKRKACESCDHGAQYSVVFVPDDIGESTSWDDEEMADMFADAMNRAYNAGFTAAHIEPAPPPQPSPQSRMMAANPVEGKSTYHWQEHERNGACSYEDESIPACWAQVAPEPPSVPRRMAPNLTALYISGHRNEHDETPACSAMDKFNTPCVPVDAQPAPEPAKATVAEWKEDGPNMDYLFLDGNHMGDVSQFSDGFIAYWYPPSSGKRSPINGVLYLTKEAAMEALVVFFERQGEIVPGVPAPEREFGVEVEPASAERREE